MNGVEWAKRLAVLVLVAALVVAGAGAGALVGGGDSAPEDDPLALPEYQSERVSVQPLPAEGTIRPDRSATRGSGTVVIDAGHGNRFSRDDIQPLVEALTRVGYSVQFYTEGDLATRLEDAAAFVVIDPATEYRSGDVDDIRRFTGQGGRLLIAGEPSRVTVGGGLFGGLRRQESAVTTLATSYGMSLDTAYLYNQERADANYKFITTEPGPNADIDGVNRTTMYTAASVRSQGGRVLLRTAPNTFRSSTDDERGQYPVAVRRNNVVLLGDTTFLRPGKHNVADNEAFVAYLVEFLASGDRTPGAELVPGSGGQGANGGQSANGGQTTNATEPQPTDGDQ